MKRRTWIKSGKGLAWITGVMVLIATSASAAEVGGKPEKPDVTVTYAQASGAFTPIWVANDAGLFKKYGLNTSFNCSIHRFPLKR
jgi:ABC-type nitrate/sulfonate/bicarbonate transport system substrate-binding protein